MGRFDGRWVRLAVVAGAIVGSALVSSAVVAADEPADESIGESVGESIVVEVPPSLPLEDIAVIEMVVVEPDVPATDASGPDATDMPLDDTESGVETGEEFADEPVLEEFTDEPVAAALPFIDEPDPDEGSGDEGSGDEGHQNGNVGEGRPYLVTFEVEWLDPQGTPIAVLDAVLPIEWRSVFELSADSLTGQGPTSANCTHPAGSDVLQCVVDTAGHDPGSDAPDGLIVPGSTQAQYTVTVVWPPTDWTIDGANEGPYSARQACPRGQGGGGHEEGGHEADGHEEGGVDHGEGSEGSHGGGGQGGGEHGGDGVVPCVHRVIMQQIAVVVPPTEPPTVVPEPEVTPPAVPDAIAPIAPVVPETTPPTDVVEAAPIALVAQQALPVTGSSVSMLLWLAGLLVVAGSSLAVSSRRT